MNRGQVDPALQCLLSSPHSGPADRRGPDRLDLVPARGACTSSREDSYLALNYEGGYLKILGVTVLVLLCSHWLDLYDTARLNTKGELYFRLLMVPGVLAFILAGVACGAAELPAGEAALPRSG